MRFAKHYIIKVLKEGESGVPVTDLYRLYGFSISSFYKRKAKYDSLAPSSIKHLEELEEETRKLKQMYT
ncbi:MAG: transposase [Desulfobacteraceae bacterium]|nr:transposase [Desulfobacteraceae bacterium]